MIRRIFRISTILMNSMILCLAMYFWIGELKPVERGFLVMRDLKYIEFIERIYNGNSKMETFTLKTLGVKQQVKPSSYNSAKHYFGFGITGSDIGSKLLSAPISNLNSRSFFDALQILEKNEYTFASPALIYARNAHLYTLMDTLCRPDIVKNSLDSFNTAKLKWQSDNSINSTMERFCAPSYPPSTDFTYCYASVVKHRNLAAVIFCTMAIPFIFYVIFFILSEISNEKECCRCKFIFYVIFFILSEISTEKECCKCKMFYYIEDANAFLNGIFLTACSMELADGLTSGIPGSFCPEDVTGLYTFYLRFIFIFIFLSTIFIINVFSAITDLIFYLHNSHNTEKQIKWWKVRGANTNIIEHADDLYEYE